MSNYVIDPSVFYWMNIFSHMQTTCSILGGFTLAACIILGVIYLYKRYDMGEKPELKEDSSLYDKSRYERDMKEYNSEKQRIYMLKKWFVSTLIIGLFLVIISMFIPSKQTSIEMLVARTATFDNVNWTVTQVKEIVDYIVWALKGM